MKITEITLKHCNNNKGFSLIEIISVLLILGIISATVITKSGSMISINDLVMEAETLKANLRYTQMMSMNTNGNEIWRIYFPDSGGNYTIQQYISSTWTDKILPGQNSGATHEFTSGITASSNPTIYYDIWGIPVISEIPPLNAQTDSSKLSITLSDGTNIRYVKVTQNTGFTFVE